MKRRYRLPILILLSLALLLVMAHLILPYVIREYLNDKLAVMGDYRGRIEDVDLAWWRGGYRIDGLKIVKIDRDIPVPFLDAPRIDLSISGRALWYDRAVVGRVEFERPELNFVDGGTREESQTGEGVNWRAQLEKLLPITLHELKVVDGQVSFRNFKSDPPVDLKATAINASVYNLTNLDQKGKRVAHLEGHAQVLGQAPLEAEADFKPLSNLEDFQLRLRVTDVDLTRLNDFARAYGRFDFAAGRGDLVIEAEAENNQLSGYIKPLLRHVEVFNWKQDMDNEEKGFLRGLWEALVGGGETILKNQRKDQFATRIELSGNLQQKEISPLQAFLAILHNAFVEAFTPRFERALEKNDTDSG